MADWENIDEWVDQDRETELTRIKEKMAALFGQKKEWQKAGGDLLVDYLVMVEALRECTRRYLESTGRAGYGTPTLENEISFFKKLGENQVIFSSRP